MQKELADGIEFSANVILPSPQDNAVTIVVAVDENYIPHLAALVESIKNFFPEDRFLELIVLDGGIRKQSRALLEKQFFCEFNCGKINFINCKGSYKGVALNTYFTEAILYRVSAASILPNHKKILYLDTDLIVLSDISELFDIDLGETYAAAAAPELYMKVCIKMGSKKRIEKGVKGLSGLPIDKYLKEYLGLGEDAVHYFQSGVMLFNLDHIRASNIENIIKEDLLNNKYWLPDQDVLNKYLKGKVLELPLSWNLSAGIRSIYKDLTKEWAEKVDGSIELPKIIHYAGSNEKPWKDINKNFSNFYWLFLRRTFWYENVVQKLDKKKGLLKFFSV